MTKTDKLLQPSNLPYLEECFDLSEIDQGTLIWKERPRSHFKSDQSHRAWNKAHSGKPAGKNVSGSGYCVLPIKDPESGASVYVNKHRLIWLLVHREAPPKQIDHINRVSFDNRPSNLRAVSQKLNCRNKISHIDCPASGRVEKTDKGTYKATLSNPESKDWTFETDNPLVANALLNYLSYLCDSEMHV